MEPMWRNPRLKRRGAVYYFRCKIPADLIAHYGTKEITKSLGTTDPADALLLVRQVSARQDQQFARIRAAQRVTTLPDHQVQNAAQAHLVNVLTADEIQRTRGLSLDAIDAKEARVEEADDMLREAYAVGCVFRPAIPEHVGTVFRSMAVLDSGPCRYGAERITA